MAISTGGAVPEGADAVVPLELARRADGTVEVEQAVPAGANVRGRGGDVTAGTSSSSAGEAGSGAGGRARRGRRRRGAVCEAAAGRDLVTGSELRQPGEELGPGQITSRTA